MDTNQNDALNDQNVNLKNSSINNANDGIGENSEQTTLARAIAENAPEKGLQGSEGGSGWKNNKPGATNEEKNEKLIPVVTQEDDNS